MTTGQMLHVGTFKPLHTGLMVATFNLWSSHTFHVLHKYMCMLLLLLLLLCCCHRHLLSWTYLCWFFSCWTNGYSHCSGFKFQTAVPSVLRVKNLV
jgi:hypothetical protein